MKKVPSILLLLAVAAGTVLTYLVPDTRPDATTGVNFMEPSLARMIFWHLPCALTCSIFLFVGPISALMYLRTKKPVWDARANAANEVTLLMAVLTLATGMLFAKAQWGDWWNWDPRQTSFLIATLFIAVYFALRAAFDDDEKRAANSAAYSIATLLPVLFLIFVFPRLPMVTSLHPDVVRNGGFDSTYRSVFLVMFALYVVVCVTIYRLRVRLSTVDRALDDFYAELADRDRAPTLGVVRPIPVPESDRQEGPGG